MVEMVAEISGNHGGSLNKAIRMIGEAAYCGCDYVKFQLYRPWDMPDRHQGDNWAMYRKLMVRDEWLPSLFAAAHEHYIGLFASVFSVRAVETLLKFDVPFIKIASMSSTPLSKETFIDIVRAVGRRREIIYSLNADMGLPHGMLTAGLQLVCPPTDEIWEAAGRFDPRWHYGFSDHTAGVEAPLRFIRRGARMIEKHFKIDDDCIDAAFSADPETMKLLCKLAHNR